MAAQIQRLVVSLTDTLRATRESVTVGRAIRPSELDVQTKWHAESSVAPTAVVRQYLDWASSCWRQTYACGPWLGWAHAKVAEERHVRRLLRVGVARILCSYTCHVAGSFLDSLTRITYIHRVPEGSHCAYL